jgi:hypothetical protein
MVPADLNQRAFCIVRATKTRGKARTSRRIDGPRLERKASITRAVFLNFSVGLNQGIKSVKHRNQQSASKRPPPHGTLQYLSSNKIVGPVNVLFNHPNPALMSAVTELSSAINPH